MCDAYIYVPQSLTMMHVCMMHISMVLDLDPEACVYGACVYDGANFVPNQRTNGRTDERTNKAILGVWWKIAKYNIYKKLLKYNESQNFRIGYANGTIAFTN